MNMSFQVHLTKHVFHRSTSALRKKIYFTGKNNSFPYGYYYTNKYEYFLLVKTINA